MVNRSTRMQELEVADTFIKGVDTFERVSDGTDPGYDGQVWLWYDSVRGCQRVQIYSVTAGKWTEIGMLADYNLEVLRGNVTGHSMVSIFGLDKVLDTTQITIAPTGTTVNINQSGLHTTAATVDVASTSANDDGGGSGLLTLLLIGLDSAGVAQTETITMDGTTEVTSANTYSAIHGWRALTWGATTWNEGTIWIGNGTFTAGVPSTEYFAGDIRANRGHTAYYTVPAGKTLYLRQITLGVATSNKDVEFFVEVSTDGIHWYTEAEFVMETFLFQGEILSVPGIPAGSSVRIEGVSSAGTTDVTAILGCELVDN